MEKEPASLLCCVHWQGTLWDASIFKWQTDGLPVLHWVTIVKLLTQHVVKGDFWVSTMAIRLVDDGATSYSTVDRNGLPSFPQSNFNLVDGMNLNCGSCRTSISRKKRGNHNSNSINRKTVVKLSLSKI